MNTGKFLKYIFISVFMFLILFTRVQAAVIYVDKKTGNNSTADGSENNPYRTIQKGVDNASAGDTVIVKKEVYFESVHIKKKGTGENNRIKVIAQPGTVLTCADPAIRLNPRKDIWTCENAALKLYSAPLTIKTDGTTLVIPDESTLFPTRMLMDDTDLLQYPSLDALETFVLNHNDRYHLDGYSHGYYYDAVNKKIYVRLPDDGSNDPDPNEHIMKVSPSYYKKTGIGTTNYGLTPGYGSYNILVGEKGTMDKSLDSEETVMPEFYVDIEGFTFETPGLTGIFLRASNVNIKNCKFVGCRYGVKGAMRVFYDMAYAADICVENCDYSQYPTYDDAEDFIKQVKNGTKTASDNQRAESEMEYPWWHKKSYGTDVYGIDINLRYEVGGFVGNIGERWKIKHNYIHDSFDGINGSAMTKYYEKCVYDGVTYTRNVGAEDIEICYNRFEKCLDNCIEFEEHGKNVKVHHNEFINNFLPISSQPTKGPDYPTNIYIYKNLIYNKPAFGKFWSQTASNANFAFKIGAKTTNWTFPWSDSIPAENERAEIVLKEKGFNAYNNTIIMPYGYPIAFALSNSDGWEKFKPLFYNMRFKNNVLICHVKKQPNPSCHYFWDGITQTAVGGVGGYIMNKLTVSDSSDPDYPGTELGIQYRGNVFAPDGKDGYVSSIFTKDGGRAVENISELKFYSLSLINPDFGAQISSPLFNNPEITSDENENLYGYAGAFAPGEHYVKLTVGVIADSNMG